MPAAWRHMTYGPLWCWYARVRGNRLIIEPSVAAHPRVYTWHVAGAVPAVAHGPYLDVETAQLAAETWAETHPRARQKGGE